MQHNVNETQLLKMNYNKSEEANLAATGFRTGGVLQRASLWLARKVGGPVPDHDEENCIRPTICQGTAGTMLSQKIVTTDRNSLVPSQDKLLIFRSLTGIDTVPTVYVNGHAMRAAPNMGVYPRVVRAEQKAARSFTIYNILVNICLGLQLIVGAGLTALGASGSSQPSVTAFGALNTITAGFLTYLKGSNMPTRIKTIQDAFKAVREYAEQREREFCLADCALDPVAEAGIVTEMYQNAQQQLEGNNSASPSPCKYNKKDTEKLSSVLERLELRLSKPLTATPS